jgi:hypothetical protein
MSYIAVRRLPLTFIKKSTPLTFNKMRQIIYPAIIFVIVGLHRSAKDEVFTGDVLDSSIEGPMTIVEVDLDAETQDYGMGTISEAYTSQSDPVESRKAGPS